MQHTSLYVAMELQEVDPGYRAVSPSIEALGQATPLGTALWQLSTALSLQEAFKRLNGSMMDRRIGAGAGLLVLDPLARHARWHLRQPLSDLIRAQWDYQNNLFISFSLAEETRNRQALLTHMTRLGIWAPISKTTWYVSSPVSSKDAFRYLLTTLESGDRLCVFDSAGNQAVWREG